MRVILSTENLTRDSSFFFLVQAACFTELHSAPAAYICISCIACSARKSCETVTSVALCFTLLKRPGLPNDHLPCEYCQLHVIEAQATGEPSASSSTRFVSALQLAGALHPAQHLCLCCFRFQRCSWQILPPGAL